MRHILLACLLSGAVPLSAQDLLEWPALPVERKLELFKDKFTFSQGEETYCLQMQLDREPAFDYARLRGVTKAAIIGFNVNLDITSAMTEGTSLFGQREEVDVTAINPMADSMYLLLRKRLEGLGIRIVSPAQVASCPAFASLPSNDPWKLALYAPKWQVTAHAFALKSIDMDDAFYRDAEDSTEILTPFRDVASQLGVDVLIVASSTILVDYSDTDMEPQLYTSTWNDEGHEHIYRGLELDFLNPRSPDLAHFYIGSIALESDEDMPEVDMESDFARSLMTALGSGSYTFRLDFVKPVIIAGYDAALSAVTAKLESERAAR
ncbi:MAG: hypothetical protein WB626_08395 [Bacteroidota bacterium]